MWKLFTRHSRAAFSTARTVRAAEAKPSRIDRLFFDGIPKSDTSERRGRLFMYGFFFSLGAITAYQLPVYKIYDMLRESQPEPGSFDERAYIAKLERAVENVPAVQKLRRNENFRVVKPWSDITEQHILKGSLVSGALSETGGISGTPLVFRDDKNKREVVVMYTGKKLSSYPFVVHGGILATLIDEVMAATGGLVVGKEKWNKVLELRYHAPSLVNQFLVISAEVVEEKNVGGVPTAYVRGKIESQDGKLLVSAKGEVVSVAQEKSGKWNVAQWLNWRNWANWGNWGSWGLKSGADSR